MNTVPDPQPAVSETTNRPVVKIFGVGNAGVELLELFSRTEFAGADFVAINTDAA